MTHLRSSATFLAAVLLTTMAPGHGASHAEAVAAAAQDFLQSLDEEQRAVAQLPLDTNERAKWSNLPIIMVQPAGVLIRDLADEQRRAAHALMRATLSSQGYAKLSGIMLLDDLLHQIESQALLSDEDRRNDPVARAFVATRGYENYAIAVFGDPGEVNWGWKIAGHHAAANFTVSGGQMSFTPTFLGSSPMEIQSGRYAGLMALSQEGQRGVDFMNSLDGAQQKQAKIADAAASDVFEGPGRRNSLENYEGLQLMDLSEEQKRMLHRLVAEYLHNADHDAAHAQMAAIKDAGWDKLWFSWRGPVAADGLFYYRVHGPRILIEYNRQNANHDHMIVRDPSNDYGEDWLGKHYEEHHPSFEDALENARRRAASQSAPDEN